VVMRACCDTGARCSGGQRQRRQDAVLICPAALWGPHRKIVCLGSQDLHQLLVDIVGFCHARHFSRQEGRWAGRTGFGGEAPQRQRWRRCQLRVECLLAASPALAPSPGEQQFGQGPHLQPGPGWAGPRPKLAIPLAAPAARHRQLPMLYRLLLAAALAAGGI
jgi:hypothetical protein